MLIHICDRCKEDISGNEPNIIFGRELCDRCAGETEAFVNQWIDGEYEEPNGGIIPENVHGFMWNDQQLGFPSERGFYLITVEFVNKGLTEGAGDVVSTQIRIAKYTGAPCWYKLGKEFGLVEETGGKVTAWAELPEAYRKFDER